MTAPIITISNETNEPMTQWDAGIVQQNKTSNELPIRIWNNKGGETALSDLKEVTITTLDVDGTATTALVTERWVGVKVPGIDGSDAGFTQIGGAFAKSLRADGLNISDGFTISGVANDGSYDNAKANYCTVILRISVPLNASAGIYDFKTKISGYYT
jgi:hypothetical protein